MVGRGSLVIVRGQMEMGALRGEEIDEKLEWTNGAVDMGEVSVNVEQDLIQVIDVTHLIWKNIELRKLIF